MKGNYEGHRNAAALCHSRKKMSVKLVQSIYTGDGGWEIRKFEQQRQIIGRFSCCYYWC